MSDLRDLLARTAAAVDAPAWPTGDDIRSTGTGRRLRARRVRAVVAAGVAAAVVAGFWLTPALRHTSTPPAPPVHRTPVAVPHGNGTVAVMDVDRVVLVDPATHKAVASFVLASRGYPLDDIAWSPDGRQLAWVADDRVSVLDVSTRESRRIGGCLQVCSLAWSPDGTRLAVAEREQLQLWDLADGERRTILTVKSGSLWYPSWSPDGRRLVFSWSVPATDGFSSSLSVVDADGSGLAVLVEPPAGGLLTTPSWSAEGRVGYVEMDRRPDGRFALRAMTIDPEAPVPTLVTPGGVCYCLGFAPGVAWSPDGTQLAAVIGGNALYVVDQSGNRSASTVEAIGRPAWRPLP